MRYYKLIDNGYITAIGTGNGGTEITEQEYRRILDVINNCPNEPGYGYQLMENLFWRVYELPSAEPEGTAYTEEALLSMSNAELQAILAEMGISASMTKANMARLILSMQGEAFE